MEAAGEMVELALADNAEEGEDVFIYLKIPRST